MFALAHRPWKICRNHYNAPIFFFPASYTTAPSVSQGICLFPEEERAAKGFPSFSGAHSCGITVSSGHLCTSERQASQEALQAKEDSSLRVCFPSQPLRYHLLSTSPQQGPSPRLLPWALLLEASFFLPTASLPMRWQYCKRVAAVPVARPLPMAHLGQNGGSASPKSPSIVRGTPLAASGWRPWPPVGSSLAFFLRCTWKGHSSLKYESCVVVPCIPWFTKSQLAEWPPATN